MTPPPLPVPPGPALPDAALADPVLPGLMLPDLPLAALAAITLLLVLAAFFSASETALGAISRSRLRLMAERGEPGARRALALTGDAERMIGVLLLGNNMVKILAAGLAVGLVLPDPASATGIAVATLVMTALALILAEVLPRSLAINWPEPVAIRVAPVILGMIWLLAPAIALVRLLVRAILRLFHLFGLRPDDSGRMLAAREDIAGAIAQGLSEGAVEKEDRNRLLGALDLADRTVEEVMLHRSRIETIDADLPAPEILSRVLASPHTRLPLWRDDAENIVGVIHAKELLREVERALRGAEDRASALAAIDVLKVAMKPYFVPDTTTLDEQMREFLKRRTHFALVVDEYGTLRGLITLEDIIEEIVGDIADEFDVVQKHDGLTPGPDGDYLVDGAMTIRDLNRATDWKLPDEEANTVAGLVIHEAQMIPQAGQAFRFHGFRFEVTERRENRLTRLRIRRIQNSST